MKDKLEPNMYVRTKNGNIRKIVELTNTKFIDEPDYYVDKVLIDIEQNERENTIYMEKWLFNEDIVKASYNITDILEVGDIISFYEDIDNYKKQYVIGIPDLITLDEIKDKITNDNIRLVSILTKQEMEQMEYKVGE